MANNKKTLYVGGLAEEVDIKTLKVAFLPFGDVTDISLPMDYSSQKHKGFAFVEFQSPEDAADAIDNMDNAEILGRTIRVNLARPMKFKDSNNKPIWADDDYLRKVEGTLDEGDENNGEKEHTKPSDDTDGKMDED